MKRKFSKFTIIIMLLLVVIATMALLTACSHKHNVLKWRTIKEPTCTTEGLQRGACADCGEVVEEAISPVEDNHVWGEWEVTVAPSYNRNGTGEVQRVCSENPEHVQKETLPRLTDNGKGYKEGEYEIYVEPTVVSEGRLSAVYVSEAYGEIAFTVNIPKKEFDENSVEDAVLVGSSNKELIRSGYGYIDIGYNSDGKHNYSLFSYEFGKDKDGNTDYIHTSRDIKTDLAGNPVYTTDSDERWVSLTSAGKIFGVQRRGSEIREYKSASSSDFDGYFYQISRITRSFYGAEGLLYTVYNWGKKNFNNDFEEHKTTDKQKDTQGNVINPNGETVYWFQFGYYDAPQYFGILQCRFMLTEDGAIRYLKLTTDSYYEEQFETQYQEEIKSVIAYLPEQTNPTYNEVIEYHQTLMTESPEEPEREYTEEAFKVSGFKVTYHNKELTEEASNKTPSFGTGGDKNVLVLDIGNITPSTADFNYDPLYVYRITEKGKRILLDYSDSRDLLWYAGPTYNSTTKKWQVSFYSRIAGDLKVAFVTQSGYEKIVTIHADYSAPTALYPSINEYSDAGYVWKTASSYEMDATIYVGQPLEMQAVLASTSLLSYVDPSVTASILDVEDSAIASLTTLSSGNVQFVASVAGTYTVEMRSTLDSNILAKVNVTVEPAPLTGDILKGEYNATFKKFTATISFAEPDGEGNIYATVTTDKGEEILRVWYDTETKEVRSEHAGGATLGTRIEMNEAYKLVLVNPKKFGSATDEAVMFVLEAEE